MPLFSVNYFCRFRQLFLPVHLLFLTPFLSHSCPVAGDVEFQDVDVVGEPVQQPAGEAFRSEHVSPFVEEQVRAGGGPGHVASSSMISRPRRDRYCCRLSSGISSRVSSGPLYLVFTGATQQRGSPAAVPQPRRLPWAYSEDMTTWSVSGGTSPRASLSM